MFFFLSVDRGVSPGAGDCHGNRLQGGDLQQRFMMDGGGVGEERKREPGRRCGCGVKSCQGANCLLPPVDRFRNYVLHFYHSEDCTVGPRGSKAAFIKIPADIKS